MHVHCHHRCDIVWSQCVNCQRISLWSSELHCKGSNKWRIHVATTNEFISKKCDKVLKVRNMPITAAMNENIKCFFCNHVPTDTFCIFDKTEYNNNPFMEQIEHNQQTIGNNPIICNKCNTFLHGESLINCVIVRMNSKGNWQFYLIKRNIHYLVKYCPSWSNTITTCKELHMQRISFTTQPNIHVCLAFKCESTPV